MSVIKPITAKSLVNPVKQPDTWFGLRYNMNLYRGCQHRCIYCDSRSLCYQVENFDHEILYKENAIEQIRKELSSKRVKGTIGTGAMNDPYMPIEKKHQLTRQAMQAIADFHFPVHILTKSDLVLRDMDILQQIKQQFALVSFTITATEDSVSKIIEPYASPTSKRFAAMNTLAKNGIQTGMLLMPLLPYITDTRANVEPLIRQAVDNGASFVLPSLGVTMRDRQRVYFYEKLDEHFPGLREKYERRFGEQYFAPANHIWRLEEWLNELCAKLNLPMKAPIYDPVQEEQMALF